MLNINCKGMNTHSRDGVKFDSWRKEGPNKIIQQNVESLSHTHTRMYMCVHVLHDRVTAYICQEFYGK